MTETEFVIAGFERKFQNFKDRRIVLHGSRGYAEAIIENFAGSYHFTGIMSRDPLEGTEFHGIPVLHEEEIPELDIDMILLTERVRYAEEVYTSLDGICREKGILLYNMYGVDEQEAHDDIERCTYKSAEEWIELCRPYDVVAIEAVDTLYSRYVTTKWFESTYEVRPAFRKLIRDLHAGGKEVRISLRKSCPEAKQLEVLRRSGLFADLESCLIRRRGEDLSFRTLTEEAPGRRILYIGSGLVNECLLPRCYGIDTYRYVHDTFDCLAPKQGEAGVRAEYREELKAQFEAAIMGAELVSFDVFDTLIQRMTLYPEDVFHLVERRAKAAGIPAENFVKLRTEAERSLEIPNIYEIYDALRESCGWSEEETGRILELELSVEDQVIVPRTEVVELMQFALAKGKTVVLTSDMYLTEALLGQILARRGIGGYSKLYVSCDVRKAKYNGLYECLRSICPEEDRILHIGDDRKADGRWCGRHGIRSMLLPSALELAKSGSWRDSVECAESLMERCLMGMAVSELFRDPFRNPNLQEVSAEERLRRFASGVTGPIVAGYLTWLIRKLREEKFSKVLFFARDGYLPEKVYRGLHLDPPLPEPVYFYANRHAAFLTCSDDQRSVKWIANTGRHSGLAGTEILKNVYGLEEEDILQPDDGETEEALILRHMPKIRDIARSARKGYRTYAEKCGLKREARCAVFDFIAAGSTQWYLERILPQKLKGFYFGNYERDKIEQCEIEIYLKDSKGVLMSNYIELESFLSAAEPSIERITEEGEVEFQQEVRTRQEIDALNIVLDKSGQFAKRFFELFYEEGEVIRPELPETMFAADGYHRVQQNAYEDWFKRKIETREWRDPEQ